MNDQGQKIGMSWYNWVFSIFGLLLFLSFIFLPPIFRAFVEDEETLPPASSPSSPVVSSPSPSLDVSETISTTCTKSTDEEDSVYFFSSTSDDIQMIALTTTTHYDEVLEEEVSNCTLKNEQYQNIAGLVYECRMEGNDEIVDSRITVKDFLEESVELPISVDWHQKATDLTTFLTEDGFQCESQE